MLEIANKRGKMTKIGGIEFLKSFSDHQLLEALLCKDVKRIDIFLSEKVRYEFL